MSGHHLELQNEEFEKYIVFTGSSPEDVAHAKLLWNSLSLMPPQESRLVSSDIRQRLPVARPPNDTTACPQSSAELRVPLQDSPRRLQQRQEEREKYLNMAKQRKEIMNLLKKQRLDRIKREMLSRHNKPNMRDECESGRKNRQTSTEDLEVDIEEVKQLQ